MEPPATLTKIQADVWRAVAATKPPEWFAADSEAVLVAYCQQVESLRNLSRYVEQYEKRKRLDAAVTGPLGEPPQRLSDEQKVAWEEIVRAAPIGVLRSSDRLAVEQLARLIASSRDRKRPNPAEEARISWYFGQFGLTASARAKFGAPEPPKPQDDADKYLLS